MLQHAFKEWAVICKALAIGRQSLILRKGGIAEQDGEFHVDHRRFWLFPTYVHEQAAGLRPDGEPLLAEVEAEKPPEGIVRLSHFAEVTGIYVLNDIVGALKLADLHLWSNATVQARFAYRRPGLFALAVRVFQTPSVTEVPITSAYAGCRSWVELDRPLPTEGATPVLDDAAFASFKREIEDRLRPIALA
jgi:hypothetical protein